MIAPRILVPARVGLAAAVLLATFVVSQAPRLGALAPAVVAGVLAVANLVLLRWSVGRASRDRSVRALAPLIAGAWLVVSILPLHNFASRSSASATSSVALQPLLELVAFGAVALVSAAVVRSLEPTLALARPPMLLFLLPAWVVVSSLWSETGPYAATRGAQMAAVVLLAWATLAVARAEPGALDDIVTGYVRWFLRITVVLVALGVLFGAAYVAVAQSNADRFTWVGAHPNGSGLVLSAAVVIAFTAPADRLRLPRAAQWAIGGVLLVAMYDNHSRAAWLCVAVGLLVAFVLQGHRNRLSLWILAPVVGASVVAALAYFGEEIGDYLLRDRDSENLATGNGRRELWGIGFRALDGPLDWLGGLGYGVARSLFLEEAPWAGEAHNSVLSLLVSVGLIGVGLLAVVLVTTAQDLFRGRAWARLPVGITLVALLVLMFVNGMATDVLAEPNLGFAVLNLVAVTSMARHEQWAAAAAAPPAYARAVVPGAASSSES